MKIKYFTPQILVQLLISSYLMWGTYSCASNIRYAARPVRSDVTQENKKPVLQAAAGSEFHVGQTFTGISSYYGAKFHGRLTANGEVFDMYKISAAHRFLPFETLVRVTNLNNNLSVIVPINDRGPFVDDRILDLSYGAAKKIDMIDSGVAEVKLEIIRLGK